MWYFDPDMLLEKGKKNIFRLFAYQSLKVIFVILLRKILYLRMLEVHTPGSMYTASFLIQVHGRTTQSVILQTTITAMFFPILLQEM